MPTTKNKIKPNGPCPCGSGKKYKKCCKNRTSIFSTPRSNHSSSDTEYDIVVREGDNLLRSGQLYDAYNQYTRAVALMPREAEIHFRLGAIMQEISNFDAAEKHYRQAIELRPDYFTACLSLGEIFRRTCRMEEAFSYFKKCLELQPDDISIYKSITGVLLSTNVAEAEKYARLAITLSPKDAAARSNLLLILNYKSDIDQLTLFREHRQFAKTFEPSDVKTTITILPEKEKDRLRIGYISPDLRDHPVSRFIEPVIRHHNRSQFTNIAYYGYGQEDDISVLLKNHFDKWRNISLLSDIQLAALIKEDQIDILVDLSGHTAGNRLLTFIRRPAPVQITWIGYPNTTGLQSIDYRLTDNVADPPGQDDFYTEKLIRLPGCFLCFQPRNDYPDVSSGPVTSKGYVTFGSFNHMAKITDEVVNLWAQLLHSNTNTRLFLKNPYLTDIKARKRCLDRFEAEGIPNRRIKLTGISSSTNEHLSHYQEIDIALDTFPYNGTTTTCEAIWMGCPVITLLGERHAGRVGASLLTSVGLESLIAKTKDEYIQIASSLHTDPNMLTTLRNSLREQMTHSNLCNGAGFTRALEETYIRLANKMDVQ